MSARGSAVDTLVAQIDLAGLPVPVREYLFAPTSEDTGKPVRRWRADLAWPVAQVLVEVDGSLFVGGRHGGTPSAMRDLEKRNAQTLLGWKTVHVTPSDVRSGRALTLVEIALGRRDVGEVL